MDYAEFLAECPDPASDEALAPLARIIKDSGTSLTHNGVFWVRVVGYAYLCQQFIAANGAGLGFTQRPIEVRRLLEPVDDSAGPGPSREPGADLPRDRRRGTLTWPGS